MAGGGPGDGVPFVCGCGVCEFCQTGDAQVCPHQTQPGFTGSGSFAERVAIHAADVNLVPLPDSVDFVTAASLGCRSPQRFGRSRRTAGSVPVTGWPCTGAGWGCRR